MDISQYFTITVNKNSNKYIMEFFDANQCARYLLGTGKLSSYYYLAGHDLLFDNFRIHCRTETCAQQLSYFLAENAF